MKIANIYVGLVFLCVCGMSHATSLLTPQSFPTNANNLNFIQDVQLQSAAYEPWESEYDSDGRCISGCLYPGITIAKELQSLEQNTNAANAAITPSEWASLYAQYANSVGIMQPNGQQPQNPVSIIVDNISNIPIIQDTQPTHPTQQLCAPRQNAIPVSQSKPLGEPLLGRPRITSPYGERIHPVTGRRSVHRGIDFAATIGTTVFSPASGTVAAVWTDATCGNGLRITHSDGYETVYCHLSQSLVKQGEHVDAGCSVAKTGNSGRTTGPHLHYGIKYNGQYIDPTKMVGRG